MQIGIMMVHIPTADYPPTYLDADEFQKFLDKDAKRSIEVVRRIGKVQ